MKLARLAILALTLTFLAATAAQASFILPDTVEFYNPGSYTSSTFPLERQDPTQALSYDPLTDDAGLNFVSLGFGGELILSWDGNLIDGAGNDIKIFETTYSPNDDNWAAYPETLNVYAWDGDYSGQAPNDAGWVFIGTAFQDEELDFNGLLTTGSAGALLLVDDSLANGFTGSGDGFDVDAVVALNGVTPLPAAVWMFGGGLTALFGLRRRFGF